MRKIKNKNDAVVGIIATFLITGLIVIVISLIQTVYIPKWMEQTEADHMEVVADQFSQLKFAIDTQATFKPGEIPMPISTSITLGNRELPFLVSSRSYGSLELIDNKCKITFTYINNEGEEESISYYLGSIKYSSENSYFIDQEYIYEAGALILSQSEGNTMSIKPPISVIQESNIIRFRLIDICPIGEKSSISGYGTYPIQTVYSEDIDYNEGSVSKENIKKIELKTQYTNSWNKYFNNILTNANLVYGNDFTIETEDEKITIIFENSDDPIIKNVQIFVYYISAQIAPGWVENFEGR